MNAAELKIDLINRIANMDDPGIIDALRKMLDFKQDKGIYQLSSAQTARVAEAEAEYNAGNILSEQQADESIEQWLNENMQDRIFIYQGHENKKNLKLISSNNYKWAFFLWNF